MAKETEIEVTEVFWVAQSQSGKYACVGADYGMGHATEGTTDIWRARRFYQPLGIPAWMGGHYKAYTAVRCHERKTITIIGEEGPWPSAEEIDKQLGWD